MVLRNIVYHNVGSKKEVASKSSETVSLVKVEDKTLNQNYKSSIALASKLKAHRGCKILYDRITCISLLKHMLKSKLCLKLSFINIAKLGCDIAGDAIDNPGIKKSQLFFVFFLVVGQSGSVSLEYVICINEDDVKPHSGCTSGFSLCVSTGSAARVVCNVMCSIFIILN